jgi:hypothetical protein
VSALRKKLITLRFRTTKEAAEFLSFVSEVVDNVIVEQSGTSVKLVIPEYSKDARGDYAKLLALVKQWRLSRQSPRKGVFKHSVTMLLSAAKLKVGIPVSAIVELLQLKGYRAKLAGGFIETNADFESTIRVVEEFSERYAETMELDAAPLVKRLAAVLATAYNRSIDEVVEALRGAGLVRENEEEKLVLAVNYEDALKKAVPLMEQGGA